MKYLAIFSLLTACVATDYTLRNSDGSLAPLPEQMEEGRHICLNLCRQVGREYQDYRRDGKCICRQKPQTPAPEGSGTPLAP